MDKISNAILSLFDALVNDEQSADIIEQLDSATSDAAIKAGIVKGVNRLKELGQEDLANQIITQTKGFAY